jgi:hypothetical protein
MAELLQSVPGESHDVWDRLELGGREWPGIAKLTISRGNKWDVKRAKGKTSANVTYTGSDPAKVKIVLQIWTSEQFEELVNGCIQLVEPEDEKKAQTPLEISHAIAITRGVQSVVVESVSGPDDNGDGTWSMSIDAMEYAAPVAVAPSGGGKGGSGKPRAAGSDDCKALAAEYAKQMAYLADFKQQANAKRIEANEALDQYIVTADERYRDIAANLRGSAKSLDAFAANSRASADRAKADMDAKGCQVSPSGGEAAKP